VAGGDGCRCESAGGEGWAESASGACRGRVSISMAFQFWRGRCDVLIALLERRAAAMAMV
jgi:hypothetical protein